jgi:hypothetical protein
MIHAQNFKYSNNLAPVSETTTTSPAFTDTKGYDYATVVFIFGVTANAPTAMSVSECATSGGSYTAISGANFDGGTETDGTTSALPDDTNDTVHAININLQGKERFIKPVMTCGASANLISIVTLLSRRAETSNVPADNGLTTAIDVG